MRVIVPVTITDASLTSSTAAEPGTGEAAWASGTTYAVDAEVILGSPSATVIITIAAPGVVSWTGNGLPNGTMVRLSTTGALPTGLTAGTVYYVVKRATDSFQLSATLDGAAITTTGSQSGTHTATAQIHRAYKSVVAGNVGNAPAIDDGTHWTDIGPTNRWACLDTLRNIETWQASPLTVVLDPGVRTNSVAVLGLTADSVEISKTSGASTVYDVTTDLTTRTVADWYDYYFAPFDTKPSVIAFDLPPYSDGVITVTITKTSGLVGCGAIVIGNFVDLGGAQYSGSADAENYSTIDRDTFGNATLVPRRSVPLIDVETKYDKALTKKIFEARAVLNAVPAVWSTLDDDDGGYYEAFLILGVYKKFVINAEAPEKGKISLEVEEI